MIKISHDIIGKVKHIEPLNVIKFTVEDFEGKEHKFTQNHDFYSEPLISDNGGTIIPDEFCAITIDDKNEIICVRKLLREEYEEIVEQLKK